MITSWHELEGRDSDWGHLGATWFDLVGETSVTVGVQRIVVEPGRWSTPLHAEQGEEEIFYVLAGDGISLQWDGSKTRAYETRAGDCIVHRARAEAHTLRAGADGLEVLAFGERFLGASTYLPRAGVSWLGDTWVLAGDPAHRPWKLEVEAGPPDVPVVSPRPATIVNASDVPPDERDGATVGRRRRDLGTTAGSQRTGLKLIEVFPEKLVAAPHCHSAEEEIFVVLDGEGVLQLWKESGVEERPVPAGSTVARPAGSGIAHSFAAGSGGMTLLAYGTRDPRDVCFYPRSGKVFFRGVGVLGRLEPVDYWDGED